MNRLFEILMSQTYVRKVNEKIGPKLFKILLNMSSNILNQIWFSSNIAYLNNYNFHEMRNDSLILLHQTLQYLF